MRSLACRMILLLICWLVSSAPLGSAPSALQSQQELTVDRVLEMVHAGLSEELIITRLRREGRVFHLEVDQMLQLKKAGVSDNVIKTMLDPKSELGVPSPAAPGGANAANSLEIGVYLKREGEWVGVPPEIVNWKTGGMLKSLASAGVVKKDLNGNIERPGSKTSTKAPVELLIVAAEGIAAEEYQLLRLRVNSDYREFRSVTGGILNQRSGAMRDMIPFEARKIAPRNYVLVLPNLGSGEYGLLPPGAGGSSTTAAVSAQYGKMYTFRLVE